MKRSTVHRPMCRIRVGDGVRCRSGSSPAPRPKGGLASAAVWPHYSDTTTSTRASIFYFAVWTTRKAGCCWTSLEMLVRACITFLLKGWSCATCYGSTEILRREHAKINVTWRPQSLLGALSGKSLPVGLRLNLRLRRPHCTSTR